jgi:REP element-mobilizing transposase RayT
MTDEPSKHGGRRPGAGRPRKPHQHDAPHRKRPSLSPAHPVHVVLRTTAWTPRLRCGATYRALRRVLVRYLGRADFRVVHISIQRNHLHLLVEAKDRRALTRGMQSFAINAARAIQRGPGKVFAYRYHATQIESARQARHALAYVLNNWRKHREDSRCAKTLAAKLDPYASGLALAGWAQRLRFRPPDDYHPLPVSLPTTQLLCFDWLQFGLVDLYEVPGPVTGRDPSASQPSLFPRKNNLSD